MTCKVSFFNSIRENLKHHIASTFVSILAFFIQFLVFFLQLQNIISYEHVDNYKEEITSILEPNYGHYAFVVFVAVILAFDYFRYLHSKKQMDFYECLPVTRRDWFVQKTVAALFVFLVPFVISSVMQSVLLLAYGLTDFIYIRSILYTILCMTLIFLVTWITAVLAMIMTGHPVVATLGFAVFCGYAPIILRYIFPLLADRYFETYVSNNVSLYFLTYISPVGLAVNLLDNVYREWIFKENIKDLIILLVIILSLFVLSYKLFVKRPAESAGRAMAFEKANPIIRILLVIPLSLYLGIYLGSVTNVAETVWMIVGFVLGVILLHGIIESIFQFDIRGLWSHKIQMVSCLAVTIAVACVFWFELTGYDEYIPKFEKIDKMYVQLNDNYFYRYSDFDGLFDEQRELAYQLVADVIEADSTYNSKDYKILNITYHMKNGTTVARRYRIDTKKHMDLIDKIYATEDYKNDICELYSFDRSLVYELEWYDGVASYTLTASQEDLNRLFDAYLSELTPMKYSEVSSVSSCGHFQVNYHNENGYTNSFSCEVFPQNQETIAVLDEILLQTSLTSNYGSIMSTILERYKINYLEVYTYEEDNIVQIYDQNIISELSEHIIIADEYFQKYANYDSDTYYDGTIEVSTYRGRNHIGILIPRNIFDNYID